VRCYQVLLSSYRHLHWLLVGYNYPACVNMGGAAEKDLVLGMPCAAALRVGGAGLRTIVAECQRAHHHWKQHNDVCFASTAWSDSPTFTRPLSEGRSNYTLVY
jgi:hypothetical protein